MEALGIVAENLAKRAKYARFAYRPPCYAMAKSARITVDIPAGTRKVEYLDGVKRREPAPIIVKVEPPKPAPPKHVKRPDYPDLPVTKDRKIPETPHSTRDIVEATAEAFNVTVYMLLGPQRDQKLARPRFAAAKLLREKRLMSYTRIGFALGRRDHTTALSQVRRADELLECDLDWAARYHVALSALEAKLVDAEVAP